MLDADSTKNIEAPRFAKVLKGREVIALSFGAMIGWSWVLMTGVWLNEAGTLGTVIAFSVGGLAIALIGLTYSELASAMPRAGGEHIYTRRALGDHWSFACNRALLFSYVNVCLFEAVALPTAVSYPWPDISLGTLWNVLGSDVDIGFVIIGSGAAAVVTWVNYLGIRTAALTQTIVTGLIICAGLPLFSGAAFNGQVANAEPWLATPASGVLAVLIMVPAMLVGFDVIPQSAEEIDLPPQQVGKLLVISVFCAVAWYVLITLSVGLGLTAQQQADSTMATAATLPARCGATLAAATGLGPSWYWAASAAFSQVGTRLLSVLHECCSHWLNRATYQLHLCVYIPSTKHPMWASWPSAFCLCSRPCSVKLSLFGSSTAAALRSPSPSYLLPSLSWSCAAMSQTCPGPSRSAIRVWSAMARCCWHWDYYRHFCPSDSALSWPEEWMTIVIWTAIGLILWLRYRARDGDTP